MLAHDMFRISLETARSMFFRCEVGGTPSGCHGSIDADREVHRRKRVVFKACARGVRGPGGAARRKERHRVAEVAAVRFEGSVGMRRRAAAGDPRAGTSPSELDGNRGSGFLFFAVADLTRLSPIRRSREPQGVDGIPFTVHPSVISALGHLGSRVLSSLTGLGGDNKTHLPGPRR